MASEPKKDEVDKLQELKEIIAVEEKEIERLTNGSKKLKEKVLDSFLSIIFIENQIVIPHPLPGFILCLYLFSYFSCGCFNIACKCSGTGASNKDRECWG